MQYAVSRQEDFVAQTVQSGGVSRKEWDLSNRPWADSYLAGARMCTRQLSDSALGASAINLKQVRDGALLNLGATLGARRRPPGVA